ncbi:Hypothetical protein CINCED_3A024940 [Cinara cedri]|uniref:Uncharacterized protein n=1 Tax=Cinara cedri TaxID=506608 RepID=A0A5E4MT42_9HEMI|nr:Hypothetical protein CINCED_3A024940 [Cinara cedri]
MEMVKFWGNLDLKEKCIEVPNALQYCDQFWMKFVCSIIQKNVIFNQHRRMDTQN